MPVSVKNSEMLFSAIKSAGITLLSALPETWLVHVMQMAEDDPGMTLIRLNKEEEGVGISTGAHFAGRKSAMLMQNHGLLTSINGIVSVAQLYRVPLLMFISYRGEMGERDPWQTEGGRVTEPLLQSLGISYRWHTIFHDASSRSSDLLMFYKQAIELFHPGPCANHFYAF